MIVVIFRATIRAVDPEYFQVAARMRTLAIEEFGCGAFHAVTEGRTEIALSYWPSAEALAAWRAHPEHRAAQEAGRQRWYESYTVEVATITRDYSHPTDR
jgi:heme-degrading monooxygenase HmoA